MELWKVSLQETPLVYIRFLSCAIVKKDTFNIKSNSRDTCTKIKICKIMKGV